MCIYAHSRLCGHLKTWLPEPARLCSSNQTWQKWHHTSPVLLSHGRTYPSILFQLCCTFNNKVHTIRSTCVVLSPPGLKSAMVRRCSPPPPPPTTWYPPTECSTPYIVLHFRTLYPIPYRTASISPGAVVGSGCPMPRPSSSHSMCVHTTYHCVPCRYHKKKINTCTLVKQFFPRRGKNCSDVDCRCCCRCCCCLKKKNLGDEDIRPRWARLHVALSPGGVCWCNAAAVVV